MDAHRLNDQNMLERSTISCDKLDSVVMNFSIIISILISGVFEWNCSYMESQVAMVAKRSSSTLVLVQQLYGKAIISKLHTQASVSNPLHDLPFRNNTEFIVCTLFFAWNNIRCFYDTATVSDRVGYSFWLKHTQIGSDTFKF